MSDTPRTDAEQVRGIVIVPVSGDFEGIPDNWVKASFAKKLEGELSYARSACQAAQDYVMRMEGTISAPSHPVYRVLKKALRE